MTENLMSKRIEIHGIVQGVGFRPFVYQLANQYGIKGRVANTSFGVCICSEGTEKNLESFYRNISEKCPPLAHITDISVRSETISGFNDFAIEPSQSDTSRSTLISPDLSVCEDCLRELFDPDDRRYLYPFVNCTRCGPRYSIIEDIPYDRPFTAMKHFKMCEMCQAEYDDPGNRRFHAQPNACPVCGPHVSLYDNKKNEIQTDKPVEKAAILLRQGYILAVKGIGGFHLAVDAENHEAVKRLRKKKHREEKPFALMSYNIESIRQYAHVGDEDAAILISFQRPILLLKKKEPYLISAAVSPGNNYFGVMLPYAPLHYLILRGMGANRQPPTPNSVLVMTSGNMSEEPIAIENEEAFERLSGIADYFLIHDREIYLRSDDSIVRIRNVSKFGSQKPAANSLFIRRSRGYVPLPIFLKREVPQILACGAELKNTICLTKGTHAFLSQHIGDMGNFATYRFFQETITHMKQILDIHPEIIAHDLHPDYMSTCYAKEQADIKTIPVQHHHAHIVSCMAENMAEGPVIGLAFDGSGYGTDGNIWGGEVLIAETGRFTRAAHLSYVPMPGGTAAIKEPWRMGVSYLYHAFEEEFQNLDIPILKRIDEKKIPFILQMIDRKINSPYTSSLGRLFDGVAAIMGIRSHVSFEGQAAMELEMLAESGSQDHAGYVYEWEKELIPNSSFPIPHSPIIRGVAKDLENRIPIPEISLRFHMTLICLFTELCEKIRKESGLNRVALSGGVFQNQILLTGLVTQLEEKQFQVFTHHSVPTNDGGIALGQAMVATAHG